MASTRWSENVHARAAAAAQRRLRLWSAILLAPALLVLVVEGPHWLGHIAHQRQTEALIAESKAADAAAAALHADARALAAQEKTLRALAGYAAAEDAVRARIGRSIFGDADNAARMERIVAEADAVASTLFTAEAIARVPWRDLRDRGTWSLRFGRVQHDDDAIAVEGPGPGFTGTMTMREPGAWRDVVVDMQVTLERGMFTLALRAGADVDARTPCVECSVMPGATGPCALAAGTPCDVELALIGSTLRIVTRADGGPPRTEERSITSDMRRAGGLAILAHAGSRFTITRLRVKDLRD